MSEEKGTQYEQAVLMNKEILDWCKDNGVNPVKDFLAILEKENPEWAASLSKRRSKSLAYIMGQFANACYYERYLEGKSKALNGDTRVRRHPCICKETGAHYRSFREAAREMDLNSNDIRRCCYGALENIKGYHFVLAEEA